MKLNKRKIPVPAMAFALVILAACSGNEVAAPEVGGESLSASQPVSENTDGLPESQTGNNEQDSSAEPDVAESTLNYVTFLKLLAENGFEYTEEKADTDSFLSVERRPLFIGEEIINVYEYSTNEDMEKDASYIDKGGSQISVPDKFVLVEWVAIPYFFKKDLLIVNYVGEDEQIIHFLTENFGGVFAGAEKEKYH